MLRDIGGLIVERFWLRVISVFEGILAMRGRKKTGRSRFTAVFDRINRIHRIKEGKASAITLWAMARKDGGQAGETGVTAQGGDGKRI